MAKKASTKKPAVKKQYNKIEEYKSKSATKYI